MSMYRGIRPKISAPKSFLLLAMIFLFAFSIHSQITPEKKGMDFQKLFVNEDDIEKSEFADRWSKDLVNEELLGAKAGFSLGVAEYFLEKFVEPGVHTDQEIIYVISGRGEYLLGDKTFPISPGCAIYVPPHTKHGIRRIGNEPVKVIYAHAPVE